MTTKLRISPDLALPLEAVTERMAFLGRTGSGKSYAAQKLAEEMHHAGAQFVVLDPVGVWWALRLAANGKDPGIPIHVFGGLRGDLQIEPDEGGQYANVIVDHGISAVLDVSQFEADTDKARFARAFLDRFFFRKKSSPSAVHLFMEEAQEFVPQNPMKGDQLMLHSATRILKIGRNFGIGGSLISQRGQEVNKKVLNLIELLFAFQTTGPHERKAIEGWISEKGIDEDIAAELPKLQRGRAHAWSPAWLNVSKEIGIGEKWTFDGSSTPKVGAGGKRQALAPIDIEALGEQIKASVEKAKAEDPKELLRIIARLQKDIRDLEGRKPEAPAVDVDAIRRETILAVWKNVAKLTTPIAQRIETEARSLIDVTGAAAEEIEKQLATAAPPPRALEMKRTVPMTPDNYAKVARRSVTMDERDMPPAIGNGQGGTIGKGEKVVLTAIAQYPDGAKLEQLSVLTGYKRSSRNAYIQRLIGAGYAKKRGNAVVATRQGVEALGSDYEPLPTGAELRRYWMDRLPEGERKILGILVRQFPDRVEADALDEPTGYKRSSRNAYLQRLQARQLVRRDADGVLASPTLFD